MRIFVILVTIFSIGLLHFSFIPSYEHGVGLETLPPVMIGNRNVTFAIGVSQASTDPANTDKEISIQLSETNTKNPVKDVTFFVKAIKDKNVLFEHTFKSDHGNLVMVVITTKSSEVQIQEGKGIFAGLFQSMFGSDSDTAIIKGPIFGSGGLYQFHIEILTADSYENNLDPPVRYDAAISIPETTSHQISLENKRDQNITIISYYDQISNFQYDSNTRSIKFTMPFDWSENNINQVSIVHEEILIPKSFGELLATKYTGYVNNLPLPANTIIIDDYSTDSRTVHIVLNKPELLDLAKMSENTKQAMEFTLQPSKEVSFPQTTFTTNAQYKINLNWDPPTIVSGSTTKFFFDIQDPYLISDKTVSLSYDFSIIQNDQEIYRQSGTSESDNENVIEVAIPSDITGSIRIKFDNVGGNSFSSAEFLAVIEQAAILPPKFPITASSFLAQGDTKIPGKYEVDLTWFPPIILVDEQTEFVFTIKSKDAVQPVPQSTYNFVILQKGSEVYRKQGTAQAGGDYVDYTFFKGQDGPTVLRIENINDSGETVEIPFVVTPEFPLGLLSIIIIGFLVMIIFSKNHIPKMHSKNVVQRHNRVSNF